MFGKSKKRYKEVRLNCPFCGAPQTEPSLAISSFCRACGEHFRIEEGVAKAPPGVHVSGIAPVYNGDGEDSEDDSYPNDPPIDYPEFTEHVIRPAKRGSFGKSGGQPSSWLNEARDKKLEKVRATQSARLKESGRDKTKQTSSSSRRQVMEDMLEDLDDLGDDAEAGSSDEKEALGASAQPVETLKKGSMEALLGGAIEKMKVEEPAPQPVKMPPTYVPVEKKKKGHEPEKRPVRCFECNHQQMVSLSATSTQCGRCSVYISLEDHEISSVWSQSIRTRGNVVVHRRGSLVGCDVACDNLTVVGKISASVDCSGNAHFKHSGKVMGNMHCAHLQVEKKCEVIFPQGVIAESADVYGTVEGNITCPGTIRIFKTGAVLGDATARAVVLKDGGVLTGNMSIQPNLKIELPEKKGYLDKFK